MINPDYVVKNMRGVWNLAFGSRDWNADIDCSMDGVFNSFWAIALSIPFVALTFMAVHPTLVTAPQFNETVLAKAPIPLLLFAEIASLALYWLANVAALVFTARKINASSNVARLIVAFNWSRLMGLIAISLSAIVLGMSGNVSIFVLVYLPAAFFSLSILWSVLRTFLPVNIVMTISLMTMLILIEIIIDTVVTHGTVGVFQFFS